MRGSRFPILLLAALLVDSAAPQGAGRIPTGTLDGNRRATPSAPPRSIVISGNVRTSSGEAPSEPASIKRLCGSETFIEGYTGHKGRFSIRVGSSASSAVTDATVDGAAPGVPQGNVSVFNSVRRDVGPGVDLSHCRLVAALPGYRSSAIQLGRRRLLDRPDVGTLVLTPLGGSSTAAVSATSLAAPKQAQKAFKKAVEVINEAQAAKLPRAIALLEQAVTVYPSYAAAWTMLGETKQRIGNRDGAAQALARAMEADPGYLRPYEPMAMICVERADWQRAAELTDTALNLDPSNVILQWLNAASLFELGRHDEALVALDRVESDETGPTHFPQTHQIRGMIFARRGDFAAAAAELRRFLELAPDSPLVDAVRKQLAEWQELGVA